MLEAARRLAEDGRSFKLSDLIARVQWADSSRDRTTIQPVVQGMTVNAGKGPASPCGKVFRRVDRGRYQLIDGPLVEPVADTPASGGRGDGLGRRPRRSASAVQERLRGLVADFDRYVRVYDRSLPFTSRQFQLHRQVIDRRRSLGSCAAAVDDEDFTRLLYATLKAWRLGTRASRLVPYDDFRSSLQRCAGELSELDSLSLEDPGLDVGEAALLVNRLIDEIGVVDNRARIVAGTKTLHHLLPDFVPPMDRAWTGRFFGWTTLDPQNNQAEIFTYAYTSLALVAVTVRPSRLVGAGWRTSLTKLLDNAVIGYCTDHRLDPPNATSPQSAQAGQAQPPGEHEPPGPAPALTPASGASVGEDHLSGELLSRIRSAVTPGQTIPTVANGKPNLIVDIGADGILVETGRSAAMGDGAVLVPAALINQDWHRLQTTGKLHLRDTTHRGSFNCALFACFPDVEVHSTRPIELHLTGHPQ